MTCNFKKSLVKYSKIKTENAGKNKNNEKITVKRNDNN